MELNKFTNTLCLDTATPPSEGYRPPAWLPDEFICNNSKVVGGYTDDSTHHVFGDSKDQRHDAAIWNDISLWKKWAGLNESDWVFCEDIIGGQYYFTKNNNAVMKYDPLTGLVEQFAENYRQFFNENIKNMFNLNDHLQDMIASSSPFRPLEHLSPQLHPKIAGEFKNWKWENSISNIVFSSQLCCKLSKIPPGTKVKSVRFHPDTLMLELDFE